MVKLATVRRVGRRAEEDVGVEVRMDIIAAQVEAEIVGEGEFQLRVGRDIFIAVLLRAALGSGDAISAKIGDARAARGDACAARYVSLRIQRVGIAIINRGAAAKAFAGLR